MRDPYTEAALEWIRQYCIPMPRKTILKTYKDFMSGETVMAIPGFYRGIEPVRGTVRTDEENFKGDMLAIIHEYNLLHRTFECKRYKR